MIISQASRGARFGKRSVETSTSKIRLLIEKRGFHKQFVNARQEIFLLIFSEALSGRR
jgi:hypothetical protein